MSANPTIGIDLGTTNSAVAVAREGKPRIIESVEGQRTMPSVVGFVPDGRILVGTAARRQAVLNPAATIGGAKRFVGRRYDSPQVEALRAMLPYEIVKAPNGDAWIKIGDRAISPSEVQSHVIEKLASAARADLGAPITRAVVTVPAYFDHAQRQAVRDAGTIAGLDVVRVLNEPTAAALAYGVHSAERATVAVLDLGGGTFDVTVMIVEDGVFEVVGTSGDMLLGGEDFDRRLARLLRDEIRREHSVDISEDPIASQRVLDEVEAAKRALTDGDEAAIALPFLAMGTNGPITVQRAIDRREFESLVADLVERVFEPCKIALADARLEPRAIDHVLIVGGMMRAPMLQKRVTEFFGKKPARGINPDEAVALGAALEASILDGTITDTVLVDVLSHTIGIRAAGDRLVPVVRRSTVIPARARKVFSTTEDDQRHVVVDIYEGEDAVASRNRLLGRFRLGGLPPGRKGEVQIEIHFSVDASGCLVVSARDMAGGRSATVDLIAGSGLDRAVVRRLADERRQRAGAR